MQHSCRRVRPAAAALARGATPARHASSGGGPADTPRRRPTAGGATATTRWATPDMPTDGVDAPAFGSLWAATLDAEVRGQYAAALEKARQCVEVAARGKRGTAGREHALRMAHHGVGLALLRLGRAEEALRSLETAKDIAIRVSSTYGGCDAYTDVGGILNDMGVGKALLGDMEGAQRDISRTLYMAERAYRPDDDLVSAACSNLAELLASRGAVEEAVDMAERAVRLTDKMERLSLIRQQQQQEDEERKPEAGPEVGGGGAGAAAGGCPAKGGGADSAMDEEERRASEGGVWALPAEILALNARGILRRLNFGRALVRARQPEEGIYYIFQALQDSRASGLRCNPVLYAQCLAHAGAAHLATQLAKGKPLDIGHLAAAGCTPENEMTFGPQAMMERALGILGPILGDRHPETVASRSNLALVLPLERGLESLGEAAAALTEGGTGAASSAKPKKRMTAAGASTTTITAAAPTVTEPLLSGLQHNQQALSLLVQAVGARDARSQCAAEAGMGREDAERPRVMWAVSGVLGVGLTGWRAAAAASS